MVKKFTHELNVYSKLRFPIMLIEHEAPELSQTYSNFSSRRVLSASKRGIDIVIALLSLALALPILLPVALIVSLDGGAVFFGQRRIGKNGMPFKCYKFRSMILDAEGCLNEYMELHPEAKHEWEQNQKLAFDPRITKIGRFLRRTSIDELPQLLNVLRGEMSIVGPRPVTEQELATRYGPVTFAYKTVRPGITGLWQVSGRNEISYSQRVEIDERYIREQSFWLDLWILYRTPFVVLAQKGAT